MQQHFDQHRKSGCLRIWQDWENNVKNALFNKACHQLLGDRAVDTDGEPIFTFNNITRANLQNQEEHDVVQALQAECNAINKLNNWMLCEACDIEEPNISETIWYNCIVCGAGNDKGVFQMRCEAIWHCLQSRKFWHVLHHLDDDPSNEVHFVKQCLNESEWVEYNGDCSYKKQYGVKSQIPTESFQADGMVVLHVHDQMILVLQ